jgi:hypothetical protein
MKKLPIKKFFFLVTCFLLFFYGITIVNQDNYISISKPITNSKNSKEYSQQNCFQCHDCSGNISKEYEIVPSLKLPKLEDSKESQKMKSSVEFQEEYSKPELQEYFQEIKYEL